MDTKERFVTVSFRLTASDIRRIAAVKEKVPVSGTRTVIAREALRIGLGVMESLIAEADNDPVKLLVSINRVAKE